MVKNTDVDDRNIKRQEEEKQKILSGEYPLKISKGKQNKHIEGTNEFKLHVIKLEKRGDKPSILTSDPQALVEEYHSKGRIIISGGKDSPPKESIKTNEVVGKYYNKKLGEYVDTKSIMIVYSKTGTHVYPKKDDSY